MSSLNIDLSEKINNRLPSQDEHSSRDETPPITQLVLPVIGLNKGEV